MKKFQDEANGTVMSDFRFADYNPARRTVPAYLADESGLITVGEVLIINGQPCNPAGTPLDDDGRIEVLNGRKDRFVASYKGGDVLVPLKGNRGELDDALKAATAEQLDDAIERTAYCEHGVALGEAANDKLLRRAAQHELDRRMGLTA